ncbi:MAG: hypothetical protein JWM27_3001, partial [Gemmatimonadetes bacterium]|nr:hypothetical protein [Gemmatimonadota bacterium]
LLAAAACAAAPALAQEARPAPHLLGVPALPPVPVELQSSVRKPGDAPPRSEQTPAAARTGNGVVAAVQRFEVRRRCGFAAVEELRRNPSPGDLRCLFGVHGPGRFGLLSYLDVPVYQPATPMPGSHVVGVPGLPGPLPREGYEEWEWRVLRTAFGPEARTVHRDLESLDPVVASKVIRLERLLAQAGVRAVRRETWRSPERQGWLFQQGRSRPGPLATATLTSWHCRVDRLGRPAGRAVDYEVAPSRLARFHELAAQVGLEGYGADSNDPGHVYFVGSEFLTPQELAVMRTVRRVPYVTLETGRPEDEAAAYGRLAFFQERERQFAAAPFDPLPVLDPVRPPRPPLHATRREAPPPAAPPPPAPAAATARRPR